FDATPGTNTSSIISVPSSTTNVPQKASALWLNPLTSSLPVVALASGQPIDRGATINPASVGEPPQPPCTRGGRYAANPTSTAPPNIPTRHGIAITGLASRSSVRRGAATRRSIN